MGSGVFFHVGVERFEVAEPVTADMEKDSRPKPGISYRRTGFAQPRLYPLFCVAHTNPAD
jgi:hypothetical protein